MLLRVAIIVLIQIELETNKHYKIRYKHYKIRYREQV